MTAKIWGAGCALLWLFCACGDDVGDDCVVALANGNETDRNCDSTTFEECGDGVMQSPEECDDGNTLDRDVCSNDCVLARCHDGFRQASEECDDGNLSDSDGCVGECVDASCGDGHLQIGVELCDDGEDSAECFQCRPRHPCGNGVFEPEFGEECDDGNAREDDGCTMTCLAAECGDGIVQTDEECDDGNDVDDDGCTSADVSPPAEPCRGPFCGDGIVQQGEWCDGGGNTDVCECGPSCGPDEGYHDGITQECFGEECDDGNLDESDSCLSTMLWNSCQDGRVYSERTDDGNPNPLEECDDGNDDPEDQCLQDCTLAVCGDGIVARKSASGEASPEQCDNGEMPEDATGDECEEDPLAYNGPAPCYCDVECSINQCGNGVVEPTEECDDGNDIDDDDCSNDCRSSS